MFMTMVDYWYYTGDNSYVEVTRQAIFHQAGPEYDLTPQNQTKSEGNDDQLFWALAAMSAAEVRFPNPSSQHASWATQAQNVFDLQASRWDTEACSCGLRWQYAHTLMQNPEPRNALTAQDLPEEPRLEPQNRHLHWRALPTQRAPRPQHRQHNPRRLGDHIHPLRVDGPHGHRAQRRRRDRRQLLARRHDAAHGVFLAGTAFMSNRTRSAVWRARTEQLLATAPAATMVEPGCSCARPPSASGSACGRVWNSCV